MRWEIDWIEESIIRWEIDRVEESIMRWEGRTLVGNEHLRPFLESEQLRFLRSNWGSSTVRATEAFQRREKSLQPSSIRHQAVEPSRSGHRGAAIEKWSHQESEAIKQQPSSIRPSGIRHKAARPSRSDRQEKPSKRVYWERLKRELVSANR